MVVSTRFLFGDLFRDFFLSFVDFFIIYVFEKIINDFMRCYLECMLHQLIDLFEFISVWNLLINLVFVRLKRDSILFSIFKHKNHMHFCYLYRYRLSYYKKIGLNESGVLYLVNLSLMFSGVIWVWHSWFCELGIVDLDFVNRWFDVPLNVSILIGFSLAKLKTNFSAAPLGVVCCNAVRLWI